MRNALAIFAKAPVVGQVKTRLCPPLSPEQATELYRCFLADTVARACTFPDIQVCLAITPAESDPLFRELLPFPVRYLPQRGESLGEREMNIFIDLLDEGFTHVVIIGSDIPTLPITHLQEAFRKLENPACDAVFGPSSDGGYYLIGAKAVHPALFENISWSTSEVLDQTLAQARRHRLNVSLISSWYDVDTEEDLHKLATELRCGNADGALRTRAYLKTLGW